MKERLDKILSSMGICSRKEAKTLVKEKVIRVNDKIVISSDEKFDPESDKIYIKEQPLNYRKNIYLMMNKPAGVISATNDDHEKTVIDLLPKEYKRPGLFPVGRLDKDTEGLLLITDDGGLAHDLLSPRKHVDKTYFVKADGVLEEKDIASFKDGIVLADGTKCMSAVLEIIQNEMKDEAYVTIKEGKYHQVKRMFASIHKPVLYLKRIRMGTLKLDDKLKEGCVRILSDEEIFMLKNQKNN